MLADDVFPPAPGIIVDVGCGRGRAARAVAETGRRVIVVDGRFPLVREAARFPGVIGGCVVDAACLPFRGAGVAGALAMEIIEHLQDPDATIAEIARIVRPTGGVLVTVPNGRLESVYRFLNPRYWSMTTHVQVFSRRRLRRLLEHHSLTVIRLRYVGFEWAVRWLVHSALRSEFDATGDIHGHPNLQAAMARFFATMQRSGLTKRLLRALGRVAGKSLSAECVRVGVERG